ncbi:hypothetical protein F5880DRAFT_1541550 [Lentinula raphanica]|nr:hypothetical protein F5880DRAFT_1541550 [Lentinula raphanica]
MYLLKIVFTWRSLAVHVLLLSVITTVIALPMGSSTKAREQTRKKLDEEKARSDRTVSSSNPESRGSTRTPENQKAAGSSSNEAGPSGNINTAIVQASDATRVATRRKAPKKLTDYVFGVAIGGRQGSKKLTDTAEWVMTITPCELLTPTAGDGKGTRVTTTGYRTEKDIASSSNFGWKRKKTVSTSSSNVNGVQIAISSDRPFLEIARLRMSTQDKAQLSAIMGTAVGKYRIDKLPNIPSLYLYARLLEYKLTHWDSKDHVIVQIISFDMSKSSAFGEAFEKMIESKGSGVGRLLSEQSDIWEWALYERIQSGDIDLDKIFSEILDVGEKLGNNKDESMLDVSQELWEEVHRTRLPATGRQNPSLPATSSQHPPLEWTDEHQDAVNEALQRDPEFWRKEFDGLSDTLGHH